jgi:hypothetical protein
MAFARRPGAAVVISRCDSPEVVVPLYIGLLPPPMRKALIVKT